MCLVKCRNFVECVVWWLMWVVLVVCVGGSVVLLGIALLNCACEWWSEVHFDGSSAPVHVKGLGWLECRVICFVKYVMIVDIRSKDGCWMEMRCHG